MNNSLNTNFVKDLFKKLKESLSLLKTRSVFECRELLEFVQVASLFYPKNSFYKTDLYLLSCYFFKNPFKIHKAYQQEKKRENLYTYGESYLTTLSLIAKACDLQKDDHLFELGSARGRSAFFFHHIVGCRVDGFEEVPFFVDQANKVVETLDLKGITFHNQNYLQADFKKADVVYLYGSSLTEQEVFQIKEKLKNLPVGAKVITVSFPLVDENIEQKTEEDFVVMKAFSAKFPWGRAMVYLHRKKKQSI